MRFPKLLSMINNRYHIYLLKALPRFCVLLFSYVLLIHHCNAQSYSFKHFEVEQGLAHNTVFASCQDSKGFLWFGTVGGLNRFDGYRFTLFPLYQKNGTIYNNQVISDLTRDKHGKIWVGSHCGLFCVDEAKQQLVNILDTIPDINKVFADRNDNVWLLTAKGIYAYRLPDKTVHFFPQEQYFKALSVCETEDGNLWFGTTSRLLKKYDPIQNTFSSYDIFQDSRKEADQRIFALHPVSGNKLLVGTSNQGVKLLDIITGKSTDVLTGKGKTGIFVRNILCYSADQYWLATESGIYILSLGKKGVIHLTKKLTDSYSLSDNAIYTLCRDFEGGVWAGTFFGGVNYYSPQYSSFQRYAPDITKHSISGSAVREITGDHLGNLWVGTENGGVSKFDPVSETFQQYRSTGTAGSLAYNNVHGLLCLGNDLWIGTYYHGLDIMDIRTGKVRKHY